LGPQSIVGAAAFNFLVLSAISLIAPDDETADVNITKKLNQNGNSKKVSTTFMFYFIALASLLAYGWIFYCLFDNTLSRLEAGLTVGFFFILLILAYSFELIIFFCKKKNDYKTMDRTFGKT
jgi:Ca2+/Na+ antiporter